MSNGNGHRWSKFWWQDWQNDQALKRCSLAARGLWMAMLCIAHDGEPCGYLRFGDQILTEKDLRDMVPKTSLKEVQKLLAELESNSVFSRDTDGAIFSRRMAKDAEASDIGRESAAKRWENKPTHPNGVANGPANAKPNAKPNGEAYGQPIAKPIAKKLESESEAEPEAEERQESKFLKSLSSSPVLARGEAAGGTPHNANPGPETAPTAMQIATQDLVQKLARKLESSGKNPPGQLPKLTVHEQIDAALGRIPTPDPALLEGEILEPPLRRGPVDPIRTVAEQLAALGVAA